MTDLFFSYDGQNYDWYLIMVSVMMANINETHPGSMEIWKKKCIQCGYVNYIENIENMEQLQELQQLR